MCGRVLKFSSLALPTLQSLHVARTRRGCGVSLSRSRSRSLSRSRLCCRLESMFFHFFSLFCFFFFRSHAACHEPPSLYTIITLTFFLPQSRNNAQSKKKKNAWSKWKCFRKSPSRSKILCFVYIHTVDIYYILKVFVLLENVSTSTTKLWSVNSKVHSLWLALAQR